MEKRSVTAVVDFERRLVSSLVMSPKILKECVGMADPSLFSPGPCQRVASWCWTYFARTGDAPQQGIEDIFLAEAMGLGETEADGVKQFLSSLSDNYVEPNEALMVKEATDFFKLRAVQKLRDGLDRALTVRDSSMAESLVAEFVAPEAVLRSSVSLFGCDPSRIAKAFSSEAQELFCFPGEAARAALGKFSRTDFVAFAAPPKRGKTWWLMKLATTAAKNGLNVLFVSLEMPEDQALRRFWQQATGTSKNGETAPHPEFVLGTDGKYHVESTMLPTTQVDTRPETIRELQGRFRSYWRGRLELRCWPTMTLTVPMLERELKDLAVYEQFTPDVLVIDYADIMRSTNPRLDERDRLNEIWMGLRGMAQAREILVATASQTGRATVNGKKDADDADLSEDIRKLAHVTKLMVINQSLEERQQGVYRLSNNTTRDEAASNTQLVCTANLAIGEPMLDSRLLSECEMGKAGEEPYEAPNDVEPAKARRGSAQFSF